MWKGSKRARALAALACATGLIGATSAAADGVGPRVGLTGDPDQVHMGLHLPTARITPNLGFMASFEAGVGDDLTLFSANMDFKYAFDTRAGTWRPYLGAGPALHWAEIDNYNNEELEVGVGVFGGMQTPTRSGAFFGEMRLGLVDSPDIKFTVGWMFH